MAAYYTFEDYSGTSTPKTSDNPYDGLIEQCKGEPAAIQGVYQDHRTNRNAQQKTKLLDPAFPGVTIDEILARLEDPSANPGYVDPRNCLVFWARPPAPVRALIGKVQEKLLQAAPNLWMMPLPSLHMTALEVTHSLTAPEIETLTESLLPKVPAIVDYTLSHRARLVKPVVSFDAQALALSFLPAAGEVGRPKEQDEYSYHHLRRDLYARVEAAGVKVGSRYVVPSAHLTIGRFITRKDFETSEGIVDNTKLQRLVSTIEEINDWLQAEFWPSSNRINEGGEWVVGEERGLDFRKGTLWYGGGGETMRLGRGF